MKKFLIGISFLAGIWIGWFIAIQYTLNIIERKQGVMSVQDWSRMRELTSQLEKDRILFF